MATESNNLPDEIRSANQSLNILYHHRTQGRGAEGIHIISIINALQLMGHRVTLLSPPGVDPLSNAGKAPVDKSNVKTNGISSLWKLISKYLPGFMFEILEIIYNLPASKRLENKLSSESFDLVYERYAFYLLAGAFKAKKYGVPFILEANEVNGIQERARPQSFSKLCGLFEKILFKRCTAIHTVSSYLKQKINLQGVPEEKIWITPNAVDPTNFESQTDCFQLKKQVLMNRLLKQKYNIKNDELVIGFAGWFDTWDRLDLLIQVFATIQKALPNLKLLLIGDGDVLKTVKTKINSLNLANKVILTGAVNRMEIHDYLRLLDIAIFTHSNEFGSPVVMFELMGLKIPIIAPRLMPITDVLVDKHTALLFEPLNMLALEQNIIRLAHSKKLRQSLANAAFETLLSKHTWQVNAGEILKSGLPAVFELSQNEAIHG